MNAMEELRKAEKAARPNHNAIAADIVGERRVIYSMEEFYQYRDGVYVHMPKEELVMVIKDILGERFNTRLQNEVVNSVKASCYIHHRELDADPRINMTNGLLDLGTWELFDHTPEVTSTIQIPVRFDPNAMCPKWLATIDEIFDHDAEKISTLQEFFGLCLTRETKYNRALFMLGEGRNGKSTVLYVLEHIVGDKNRAAIPLEKLSDHHYVAELFGKVVNISIETNAKSEVYDATFKAITSGDTLTADPKYKHPFLFRPYCKLIYALNNMPRVNDKTDAYFRRLIILRFGRQFEGDADNKTLKYELLKEIDGIFLWCLYGLRNLTARGDFRELECMKEEVSKHRMDNNSAVEFVEEEYDLDPYGWVAKGEIYDRYKEWCHDSGHQPFGKKRFGSEIVRFYKLKDRRHGTDNNRFHVWEGIVKKVL